jgi:hypothetical protein
VRLGPGLAIAGWGGLLLLWAVVFWAIFDRHPSFLEVIVPGAAVALTLVFAAIASRAARRRREGEVRTLPSVSVAVPIAALGLAALILGLEVGGYLAWVGGGLMVLGFAVLGRELVQERRLARGEESSRARQAG